MLYFIKIMVGNLELVIKDNLDKYVNKLDVEYDEYSDNMNELEMLEEILGE